ncbi:RNA polymerase factor sigma-54 [Falsiporphyromonas endometrii]|uniref:RNA polymerase factor sigma-54 n=1 Tax=Falsiporphyromonas endometrii TaxID=1387297 RepID=A0ABV9K913_9PORP
MLKTGLEQQLEQTLTARQIQQIKLLELPLLELEQRIKKELEDNPALMEDDGGGESEDTHEEYDENTDDVSLDDYGDEDDIPDYKLRQISSNEEKKDYIPFAAAAASAGDIILNQLELLPLTEQEKEIAPFLVGSIDGDGYLRREPIDLSDDIAFTLGLDVPEDVIAGLVEKIKTLDPPGIGASDLRECLMLQLKRMPSNLPERELAIKVVEKKFNDFANKRFEKIAASLHCSKDELAKASLLIVKLNPKPAAGLGVTPEDSLQHVRPDFVVTEEDGEFVITMPGQRYLPPLKVNPEYLNLSEDYKASPKNRTPERRDTLIFVKRKIEQAKWFIDAVKQRQNTLLKTMQTIVALQKDYFKSGRISDLKPMILKDVAQRTGFDISTISRIVSGKYVETFFGVFLLKQLFTSAMSTDEGEEVSNKEIMEAMKRIIEHEDKLNPLSDLAITELLNEKGYDIARRTVAKYRKRLGYPSGRLRKSIH